LPDITVASPVFTITGRLIAFVANIGHHADGGNGTVRTIFDEGLRIPPVRVVEGGVLREDVFELLLLNFRVPHERRADLRAQFAANRLGAARLDELLRRYDADMVQDAMRELLDYGERKARAAISQVPDGRYAFVDAMDDDGVDPEPIPIAVTITVTGDQIALDFAGSGRQAKSDINVVWSATLATVFYALKALLDPSIPPNGGFHRAVRASAPEGTIVNALPPAAVGWRTQTTQRIADVIFGALAPVLLDRVPAAGNGTNAAMAFTGVHPDTGRLYCYMETIGGGAGAFPDRDGLHAVQVHVTNTSNLPVEALELEYPLLVEEYALVDGSGGAGAYCGGMGIRRTIRVVDHESTFLGTMDRCVIPPWGLAGGQPGRGGRTVLNPGTSAERALPPKVWGLVLRPGDVVSMETPGGGGHGRRALPAEHRADG
jgi:N-methylhydantoinase B